MERGRKKACEFSLLSFRPLSKEGRRRKYLDDIHGESSEPGVDKG